MDGLFIHDATPTWSGFIYQGDIAIYLAVKKICELKKSIHMSEIGTEYKLEVEYCEDIAIVHDKKSIKEYISIHQVKNQKDTTISSYKIPLIQLMLEKGLHSRDGFGNTEAYLHVSKSISSGDAYKENLSNWKENIAQYYNKLKDIFEQYEKNEIEDLRQSLFELIGTDPIKLNRSEYRKYCKDLLDQCGDKADHSQNILIILKKMIEFLEKKLAINFIDDNVLIYKYEDGEDYCNGEDIYKKIVEKVKEYRECILGEQKNSDKGYEYITDKLIHFMRIHIVERHNSIQKNDECPKSIPFQEFINILDDSIDNLNREANILALRRLYDRKILNYCNRKCKNKCNKDSSTSLKCKIKEAGYRRSHIEDNKFVQLCYSLNPDCTFSIEDQECINRLLSEDGMKESVLRVIQEIPERFFINQQDLTKYVINNDFKNAYVTAISSMEDDVIYDIVDAIGKNTELVSPIFDADQLITTRLETTKDVWNDYDYGTIQKKYLSNSNGNHASENNICEPKKPEFIEVKTIINHLCKDDEGGCS